MDFFKAFPDEKRLPGLNRLPDGRWEMSRTRTLGDGTEVSATDLPDRGSQFAYEADATELAQITAAGIDPNSLYLVEIQLGGNGKEVIALYKWLELHPTNETVVGEPRKVQSEDGRTAWVIESVQLSKANAVAPTVGTSTPSEPYTSLGVLAEADVQNDGTLRRIRRTYVESGTLAIRDTEEHNGKLLRRTITSVRTVPATPSGYILTAAGVENPDGIPVYTYSFAKGAGQISYAPSSSNNGKLLSVAIRHLTAPGASNPIGTPSGYTLVEGPSFQEADGHLVWSASFAKGDGQVSRSDETRNNGKLLIATITHLTAPGAADPLTTLSGYVRTSITSQEADGHVVWRASFAAGAGRISLKTDLRNGGKLTLTSIRYLGTDDGATPTGVLIDESTDQADGHTVYSKTYAVGAGRISTKVDTRNGGKLVVTSIRYLNTDDGAAPSGVLIDEGTDQADGYVAHSKTYAAGAGRISLDTDTKLNGALVVRTVRYLGADDGTTPAGTSIGTSEQAQDGYTLYTARYVATTSGAQVRVSTDDGPVPGTTTMTIESVGAAVEPTGGVPVQTSDIQEDGYVRYVRRSVMGTIAGVKQTYKDVVDVKTPGTVELEAIAVTAGALSGTIAITKVTPPRTKTVAATVTVEITTTPPNTASVAYDLGAISCSVTSTQATFNYRGFDQGQTIDGSITMTYPRRSAGVSASIQFFPGCYLSGATSASGTFTYDAGAQYSLSSSGTILSETVLTSTETNSLVGTGATVATGYTTTGVLQRRSRPVFTALDGTTYYEVVTWSV